MSLLKDPVFMLIGISNLFGMAGLYVPFVYLVDCAKKDVSTVERRMKRKRISLSIWTRQCNRRNGVFNVIFLLQNIDKDSASFLISIIGITNTVGRIACGYFADFPWVNALFVNNICLVISTIAVILTPFCHSYGAYITMAIFFGIAICKSLKQTFDVLNYRKCFQPGIFR